MNKLKTYIGIKLYHLLENIDGEKGLKFLTYKTAQALKIMILITLIK